jgi:hypothetical protein
MTGILSCRGRTSSFASVVRMVHVSRPSPLVHRPHNPAKANGVIVRRSPGDPTSRKGGHLLRRSHDLAFSASRSEAPNRLPRLPDPLSGTTSGSLDTAGGSPFVAASAIETGPGSRSHQHRIQATCEARPVACEKSSGSCPHGRALFTSPTDWGRTADGEGRLELCYYPGNSVPHKCRCAFCRLTNRIAEGGFPDHGAFAKNGSVGHDYHFARHT